MWCDLFTNPVLLSVLILLVLALLRLNIVFSIIIAALSGGIIAGLGEVKTLEVFSSGLGNGAKIAFNYAMLGAFSIVISRSGLTELLAQTLLKQINQYRKKNDLGELVDSTIHMWEDCEGGCLHITATVANSKVSAPPGFIIKMLQENPDVKIVPNWATEHEDYEASQWPIFLPRLYELWKNHPDPSQSVHCNLEVVEENGKFRYLEKNGPVTL